MKITAIKQQAKRTDRYSVFVDDKFAFGLSESALLEKGLASGQELTTTELRALKKAAGLDKAYGNALRYAAMRPRSEWELKTYLTRKQVDPVAAQQIIDRLKGLQMVNDRAFAESWVANRRALRGTSERRLRLELKQKQVSESVINEVLAADPSDERTMLRAVVAKKQARYPDKQKFMQYLARQGFRYDDITTVLEENTED